MRRRDLLRASAAAAAAASWPGWLRRAFADDACHADEAETDEAERGLVTQVSRAWRRARSAGKPLLVLVIPESSERRWDRGHAFGELINNGDHAQIAPLALAEVVCARAADVRLLVPAARGEPLMFLVETDRVPAEVRRLDAELPALFEDGGADEDAAGIVEARVTLLAEQVKLALMPDRAVLARRAEQARAHLSPDERVEVEHALAAPAGLGLDLADRAAALLLLGGRPGAAVERVAAAAAARLRDAAPAGAHWASSFGCGIDVEPTAAETREQERRAAEAARRGEVYLESGSGGTACGMGHVPAQSRRFLYFYAVEDERW